MFWGLFFLPGGPRFSLETAQLSQKASLLAAPPGGGASSLGRAMQGATGFLPHSDLFSSTSEEPPDAARKLFGDDASGEETLEIAEEMVEESLQQEPSTSTKRPRKKSSSSASSRIRVRGTAKYEITDTERKKGCKVCGDPKLWVYKGVPACQSCMRFYMRRIVQQIRDKVAFVCSRNSK